MEWMKKYWWAILIILTLPVVINFLLLAPAFSPIVGEDTDWLAFWGGYLGSIISAGVAFIILYIQRKDNKTQNEKNRVDNETQNQANRQLQLNIMRYHQQTHWINNFRNVSLEYSNAFNSNDFIMISNIMWDSPVEAFNMMKVLFDRIDITNAKFAFIKKQDDAAEELSKDIENKVIEYKKALNYLQWIVLYFKSNTPQIRCKVGFIQYLQSIPNARAGVNHIIGISQGVVEQIMAGGNRKYFNDIFLNIYDRINTHESDVRDVIYAYIKQEQKRIDNLLTENIN